MNYIDKNKYEYNIKQIDNRIERIKCRFGWVQQGCTQRFYSILGVFFVIIIFIFDSNYILFYKNILGLRYLVMTYLLIVILFISLLAFLYRREVGGCSPIRDVRELLEDLYFLKISYLKINKTKTSKNWLDFSDTEKLFLHQFDVIRPKYNRFDIFDFVFKRKYQKIVLGLNSVV